jgi:ABC-type phosphate transport system permease subunit
LAVLMIPMVLRTTEEMIRLVPTRSGRRRWRWATRAGARAWVWWCVLPCPAS